MERTCNCLWQADLDFASIQASQHLNAGNLALGLFDCNFGELPSQYDFAVGQDILAISVARRTPGCVYVPAAFPADAAETVQPFDSHLSCVALLDDTQEIRPPFWIVCVYHCLQALCAL